MKKVIVAVLAIFVTFNASAGLIKYGIAAGAGAAASCSSVKHENARLRQENEKLRKQLKELESKINSQL